MAMREVAITGAQRTAYEGRECFAFPGDGPVMVPQGDVTLLEGAIELDLAVTGERSFPGIAWRASGDSYESFFVRPHQVGNEDAVQYTPVFNGVSGWQLYHDHGFWASVDFPIGSWFTLRVAFAGDRGEAYVNDMREPALSFARLRGPTLAGAIGILPGGAGVCFARIAYDPAPPQLRGALPAIDELRPGSVPGWWVSNLVTEDASVAAIRSWTYLEVESTGLANLARVHPLGGQLNTVFARTTVNAVSAGVRALELGFSDRVMVYLNGQPLFAGSDSYRSRDYRFLGSIGWYDKLFLPLQAGDNELLIAVSETLGGWGVQARFTDPVGLSFS